MTLQSVASVGSGATSGSAFTLALTGWSQQHSSGVTAPAPGDLVIITGQVETTTAGTWSQTGGAACTIVSAGDLNTTLGGNLTFAAWRIFDGSETGNAPAFTCTQTGRWQYGGVCVRADPGFAPSIDTWATVLTDTVSGTTHTANAATAAGAGETSVILHQLVATATGTTAITQTVESGWTSVGTRSNPGVAGTSYSQFVSFSDRSGQSGTVTPGVYTTGVATVANFYHALVRQTAIPVTAAAAPRYAPGWQPGTGLPGLPGGTPFQAPPSPGTPFAAAGADGVVTGVAAQVTAAGAAGVPAADANITGAAAAVTAAAPAGTFAAAGAVTGTAALVTVQGGAGTTSSAASVTGTAGHVTVAGGAGTPAAAASVTGTAAAVAVGAPAGTLSGSAAVTGAGAAVTVQGGIGAPSGGGSGAANVTGTAAHVTVASPAGVTAGSGVVTGVAAQVTAAGGAGTLSGSAGITGLAAQVRVASGLGTAAGGGGVTPAQGTAAVFAADTSAPAVTGQPDGASVTAPDVSGATVTGPGGSSGVTGGSTSASSVSGGG